MKLYPHRIETLLSAVNAISEWTTGSLGIGGKNTPLGSSGISGETQNPLADEAGGGPPGADPELLAGAASVPEGPPAVTSTTPGRGSVVYESLPDSAVAGGPPAVAPMPVARPAPEGGSPSMPSADELASAGVPTLNLDLHVYTSRPAERLVFINSHKYREGDTLAEGPVVQQITPRGVVLEYGGRSYLLAQQ